MKRRPVTNKIAQERLIAIRRQNVQRHDKAAKVHKLREEIQRHTANRNVQMEVGRLHEASLRHSGLDAPGLNRMHELHQKLRTVK
jgi:ribosomal 50S subunit-recycling heat shock protein